MKGEAPKILLHDCPNKPVFDIFLGNKTQGEVWKVRVLQFVGPPYSHICYYIVLHD